ncbi:hypothetical protein FDECE_14025 [Fusarium decemcellulare]|nr:hypothetical protein FDECE_14025 [Fusarium decemcellulare]
MTAILNRHDSRYRGDSPVIPSSSIQGKTKTNFNVHPESVRNPASESRLPYTTPPQSQPNRASGTPNSIPSIQAHKPPEHFLTSSNSPGFYLSRAVFTHRARVYHRPSSKLSGHISRNSSTMSENTNVSASIGKLSLNTNKEPVKTSTKKKAKKAVVDSWEDEDVSGSEPEAEAEAEFDRPDDLTPSATPAPPPPTPMSPASGSAWTSQADSRGTGDDGDSRRRPEKTDAVARRMIAAGLGLKAPKQTDEQRAYQKSIREQEKKRREQERAEEQKRQEDAQKAKAAIWDD